MSPIGKGSFAASLLATADRNKATKVVQRESKQFFNSKVVVDVNIDTSQPPPWLRLYRLMQRRCSEAKHTMAAEWLTLSNFQQWYEQSYLAAPEGYVPTWIFGDYEREVPHYSPNTMCWIPEDLLYWGRLISMVDGVNLRRKRLECDELLPGVTPSRKVGGGFRTSACRDIITSQTIYPTQYEAHQAWVRLRLEELRGFIDIITLEPTLSLLKRRAKILEYELECGEIVWKL